MKADVSDPSFVDAMSKLLGIDEKKVGDLLAKLDAQALMDLTDAVATSNRKAALRVVKTVEDDSGEHLLNPLLKGRDTGVHDKNADDEENDNVDEENDEDEDDNIDNNELSIGDAVIVRIDGKKYEATVKNPRAPGETVGVLLKGKHKMVDKSDVTRMDEMVLGMTDMGSLARMQQLAGIVPAGETTTGTSASYDVSYPEIESENVYDPLGDEDEKGVLPSSPIDQINAALDTVERAMLGVTLGDASAIKKRIYAISAAMNESVVPSRKPMVTSNVMRNRKR